MRRHSLYHARLLGAGARREKDGLKESDSAGNTPYGLSHRMKDFSQLGG